MLKKQVKRQKKINNAVDILNEDSGESGLGSGENKEKTGKLSEIKKRITLYKNVIALDKTLQIFTIFSEKGQQFTIDKLIDNLRYLI